MLSLTSAVVAALSSSVVVQRDFVWIAAKNRTTGATEEIGFWSDAGSTTIFVIDGVTGATSQRVFNGGGLVKIGPIPRRDGLAVHTVDIELSAIDSAAEQVVRGWDARGAPVQIYRGYYNPEAGALIDPAWPRFVGFIDEAPIVTAAEGGASSITLKCASISREFTRRAVSVRSDADQRVRMGTDAFFIDAGTAGQWLINWGQY